MSQIKPFTLMVNSAEINGELYYSDSEISPETQGIIICHGIPAGLNPDYSPNTTSGYEALARTFSSMGYDTIIFNFSGTGKSGGNLDLAEWVKQLEAVIKYYRDTVIKNRNYGGNTILLHLLGFSAGAAVSVMATANLQSPVEIISLALCACPGNFRFLIDKLTEKGVLEWFKSAGFFRSAETLPSEKKWLQNLLSVEPEKYIHKIKTRNILIIHGEKDDIVTPEHATNLYNRATTNKKLIIHPDEGHQLRHSEKVIKNLKKWFEDQSV